LGFGNISASREIVPAAIANAGGKRKAGSGLKRPDFSRGLTPDGTTPDFDDHAFVPVDHDPFAPDGVAQQPQIQLAQAQPQGRRSNRQHREPVNPMPVRRLQAVF
jgi:hypothetical protein